jgi:gluconate 2-dehydrogenase gamma chain
MVDGRIPGSTRRRLLVSISVALAGFGLLVRGRKPHGGSLPWEAKDISPPIPVRPGPWVYLTPYEAAAVEAIVDRPIPPDNSGPGGKSAGCAVFIDRQLAGAFGDSRKLYMRPPFANGTRSQGLQSPIVPKERYRASLAALDDYCKATFAGKGFAARSRPRSMSPERICKRKEIESDAGDGGGSNADATLVGVVKCAVKLIVAIRLTRAYQ